MPRKKLENSQKKIELVLEPFPLDQSPIEIDPINFEEVKESSKLICSKCKHWNRLEEDYGQCTKFPPSQPTSNFTEHGRILTYPVTDADLVACSFLEIKSNSNT